MIKPIKSLGQNFLRDQGVTDRIIKSVSPGRSDLIFEIGPGTGALTRPLVEKAGLVVAVETDPRLAAELRQSFGEEHLMLIEADALALDWSRLLDSAEDRWAAMGQDNPSPRMRVVANLPYYISTPIMNTLLAQHSRLSDMTLMVQDEVADRICAGPGGKEYGYLSVAVQFYSAATKLFKVPPSAFRPAPEVWSAVVKLAMRDAPPVNELAWDDEHAFLSLIRAAFTQRRKTILNSLRAGLDAGSLAMPIEDALCAAGLDSRRRAETFTVSEFASLFRAFNKQA